MCPFHWKPRPSGVSLETPGLENIPQVPVNRAKVGQNHDAGKKVLATLSVLKWSGAVFRPRSSKVSVQKVWICPFHWKPRLSGVSLESPGLENIPQVPENRPKFLKIPLRVRRSRPLFQFKKEVGLYFGLEARHRACAPFACVYFTENYRHQKLVYSPRDWKISPKLRQIEPKLLKITMRARPSWLLFKS